MEKLCFDMRRLLRWYVGFTVSAFFIAVLISTAIAFRFFAYTLSSFFGGGCLALVVLWWVAAWRLDKCCRIRFLSLITSILSGGMAMIAFKSPSITKTPLVIISMAILACTTSFLAQERGRHTD